MEIATIIVIVVGIMLVLINQACLKAEVKTLSKYLVAPTPVVCACTTEKKATEKAPVAKRGRKAKTATETTTEAPAPKAGKPGRKAKK